MEGGDVGSKLTVFVCYCYCHCYSYCCSYCYCIFHVIVTVIVIVLVIVTTTSTTTAMQALPSPGAAFECRGVDASSAMARRSWRLVENLSVQKSTWMESADWTAIVAIVTYLEYL